MTRAEMREIFKFKDGGDLSLDSDMESQPKKIMKMEENLTKPPKKQKKRSSKAASKYGLNESSSTPKTLNSENNKKLWHAKKKKGHKQKTLFRAFLFLS